jgi:nicotinamide/nicotinate riboside kinase
MLSTHPGLNTKNWDAPSAIDWPRMRKFLQDVKGFGSIPLDHIGYDNWNDGRDVPIDENRADAWTARFQDLGQRCLIAANTKVIWVLVDGFMLYWDQVCNAPRSKKSSHNVFGTIHFQDVIRQLDVCMFLRIPKHILKKRRGARFRFLTQPEGTQAFVN